MNDTDEAVGWNLLSAVSVPEGVREYFDQVEIVLENRKTGAVESARVMHSNLWIAINFAIKEITGVTIQDQQQGHDSILHYTSLAMIDVNRKLAETAKDFEWPENASIGGSDSRIAGRACEKSRRAWSGKKRNSSQVVAASA